MIVVGEVFGVELLGEFVVGLFVGLVVVGRFVIVSFVGSDLGRCILVVVV